MPDAQRRAREKGKATLFVPFRKKNMQVGLLGLGSAGLALGLPKRVKIGPILGRNWAWALGPIKIKHNKNTNKEK